MSKYTKAISRAITLGIVAVIIIVAVAGAYFALSSSTSSTTTPSTSFPTASTSSSSTSTSPPTTSSSASSSPTTSSSSSSGPSNSSTLVIDDKEWGNFQLGTANYPDFWQDAVYQYLVTFNASAEYAGHFQYVPDLASNITTSPDGKTYTFHLRQGVTFSDGNPFNSYTAWACFYLEYYMFANASNFLNGVAPFNFSNVNFGRPTVALMNQSGAFTSPSQSLLSIMQKSNWPVYVTDQNTIVFQLAFPYLAFEGLITTPLIYMFDPTYIMQHGGPGTPGNPNPYFVLNPPPGTGPYTISSVTANSRYVFTKNPTYWGNNLTSAQIAANGALDPGHFQTIVINIVTDTTVRYLDLTQGRAQLSNVVGDNFKILLDSNSSAYHWITFGATQSATEVFFAMNTQRYPTNITDVRLAMVHAVNVTQIIQQVVFGYGVPFFGPEVPIYGQLYNPTHLSPYSYNLTLAANYLSQAGFPQGKGLPSMTIDIQGGYPWCETAAELIQSDLAQIGITININTMNIGTFSSYYYGNNYFALKNMSQTSSNMALVGGNAYSPDYIGPADYLGQFLTNQSSLGNFAVYNTQATYAAFQALLFSGNLTQQIQLLSTAENQIYNDAPYDWLFVATLYNVQGSYVYNTQFVHHAWVEPSLGGQEAMPLLNTIS